MSTSPDVSKLSYAELQELVADVQVRLAAKRVEEIKILAYVYAKKTAAAGISIQEAFDALKPYLPVKGDRSNAGTEEARYIDPENPRNMWSGKGRAPRWIQAYIDEGREKAEFLIYTQLSK